MSDTDEMTELAALLAVEPRMVEQWGDGKRPDYWTRITLTRAQADRLANDMAALGRVRALCDRWFSSPNVRQSLDAGQLRVALDGLGDQS